MTETAPSPVDDASRRRIATALMRYRVLAWVTGVWLLALTFEVVAKYCFDVKSLGWIGIVHGWVYLVYFLCTVDLAIKARWNWVRTGLALVAGFIPFLSFVLEHRNTAELRAETLR
ncbi:MAG: DUF3817 domain-containing protein [Mycobacteriaceae bacterium]|nr:DUF3817 domain-containing protein [Mycobacteriaceae bacterium]